MNSQSQIFQYSDQINEIALFANRIGFDLNGDMKELARLWLADSLKIYQANNIGSVKAIIEKIVTK